MRTIGFDLQSGKAFWVYHGSLQTDSPRTVVPLNYARHSLRALTLWQFMLPFALVDSLELVTGPVLLLISWLLFGVYGIGYSIEDPFQGTLQLSVLYDNWSALDGKDYES
jgi:hypothetical protein